MSTPNKSSISAASRREMEYNFVSSSRFIFLLLRNYFILAVFSHNVYGIQRLKYTNHPIWNAILRFLVASHDAGFACKIELIVDHGMISVAWIVRILVVLQGSNHWECKARLDFCQKWENREFCWNTGKTFLTIFTTIQNMLHSSIQHRKIQGKHRKFHFSWNVANLSDQHNIVITVEIGLFLWNENFLNRFKSPSH